MAFVLETFRWRRVSSGGFPHKATKDIIWQDYCIPDGASAIGDVWSVGRDPQFFPDPETFNPQRWLTPEGNKIREDLKASHLDLSDEYVLDNIWLQSLIQWALTVRAGPDHPIDDLALTESANAHPLPFKVVFEPRAAGDGGGD